MRCSFLSRLKGNLVPDCSSVFAITYEITSRSIRTLNDRHCTINVYRMRFASPSEYQFLSAVSQLAYCNHFLPERARLEREALGDEYVEGEPVWSMPVEDPERPRENVWRIVARLEPLAEQLRGRLLARVKTRDADLALFEDAIIHLLYQRYYGKFFAASFGGERSQGWSFYRNFRGDW